MPGALPDEDVRSRSVQLGSAWRRSSKRTEVCGSAECEDRCERDSDQGIISISIYSLDFPIMEFPAIYNIYIYRYLLCYVLFRLLGSSSCVNCSPMSPIIYPVMNQRLTFFENMFTNKSHGPCLTLFPHHLHSPLDPIHCPADPMFADLPGSGALFPNLHVPGPPKIRT